MRVAKVLNFGREAVTARQRGEGREGGGGGRGRSQVQRLELLRPLGPSAASGSALQTQGPASHLYFQTASMIT
jgi:hypothetical protein